MSDDTEHYEVGFKKPPKHTQFKKGQPSPNPRGRPKQTFDIVEITRKALDEEVTVREAGRPRTMSTADMADLVQMNAAMKGDQAAFRDVIQLAMKHRLFAKGTSGRRRGGLLVVPEKRTEEEWEAGLAVHRQKMLKLGDQDV
jgi:hypothetical protein